MKSSSFENHHGDKGAIYVEDSKLAEISDNTFLNGVGEYADMYFDSNNEPVLIRNNVMQY